MSSVKDVIDVDAINKFVVGVYPATANFRCESVDDESVLVRWKYSEAGLRPGGIVSGPTLFTLADVALWYLSFTVVGLQAMAVTANLNIDFLRPAAGGDVLAKAHLLRAGKRKMNGRVEMWIDGKPAHPVAHATGSTMLLRPSSE